MKLFVLVIDDDHIFNLMANVLLRDAGITNHPLCFTNGQEALALLRQHTEADTAFLLFLDINMPLMSGWEVLDALQEFPNRSHIHVVIVTSSIDKADQGKAKAHERVVDYLIKPIDRKRLAALKELPALAHFFSN